MLSTQNEMIFFNIPLLSSKNLTFHFIGDNFWVTVASLASMQFSKDTGFEKEKLSAMASVRYLK